MKTLDAIQKVEAKLDFLLSSKDLDTKTAAHLELKLELLLRLDEAVDQFILVDHRKNALQLKWLCNKEKLEKIWEGVK